MSCIVKGQVLVGIPLQGSVLIPSKWWASICAAAIWYIWLARNTETRQNKKVSLIETKVKIWNETKLYMTVEWSKYKNKIEKGSITEDWAKYLFGFDFG